MSRYVLTAALLFLAFTAQGVTPAREGANSSGGNCPQVQTPEASELGTPAPAPGKSPDAPVAPTTAPTPDKGGTLSRPKAGAPWHSFLPGMFK